MSPRLDDIRRDDELLDALGARQVVDSDPAADLLAAWVKSVDQSGAAEVADPQPGRYARGGVRRVRRVATAAGVVVATLSVSSVAAAVSGSNVPVFRELGTVTRGFVGDGRLPDSVRATGVLQPEDTPASSGGTENAAATNSPLFTSTSSEAGGSERTDATDPTRVSTSSTTQWVRTSQGWQRRTSAPTSSQTSTASPTSTASSTSGPTSTNSSAAPSTATSSSTRTTTASSTTRTTRPTRTTSTSTSGPTSTSTERVRGTGKPTKSAASTTQGPAGKQDRAVGPPSARTTTMQGTTATDGTRTLPVPPGQQPISQG